MHKNSLRIGFLASAVLLSAPALAQADTGIEIVGLSVTESTLDEQAITEILGGELSSHAEGLAALDAQSITIDRIAFVSPSDEAVRVALSGIVLANVVDGVAASIGIDSAEIVDDDGSYGNYGLLTAADLDIQAWLSMAGLIEAEPGDDLVPVFSRFDFSGGHQQFDDGKCAFGATHLGQLEIRPGDWKNVETLAEQADFDNADLDERALSQVLSGFSLGGIDMGQWECRFIDSDGRPMRFGLGGFSAGSFTPGHWPEIEMSDFILAVENHAEAGEVSFATLNIGSTDYSHVLALADFDLDDQSPEAIRRSIPHFSGFSMSDARFDIPDGPDSRIAIGMDSFELALNDWFNGIPTDVSFALTNQTLDFDFGPASLADAEMIAMLGLADTPISMSGALSWDRDSETIGVDSITYKWGDLGTVSFSAGLSNATETLFSFDENEMLGAFMTLGLADFGFTAIDGGIIDQFASIEAFATGGDPQKLRFELAEQAAPELTRDLPAALAEPILSFLRGGGTLSVDGQPVGGAPVPLLSLTALEDDAVALFENFDIRMTHTE